MKKYAVSSPFSCSFWQEAQQKLPVPSTGTDISKTYALPDGYGWWTPSRT